MKPWPSGTSRNCPSDPAAVPRPSAHDRFSSGTTRAMAASAMAKDEPDRPMPTIRPPLRVMAVGVVDTAISMVPMA